MRISQKGLDELQKHEGVVPYVYRCQANKKTIGCGVLLTNLTKQENAQLIREDIKHIAIVYSAKPVNFGGYGLVASDELIDKITKRMLSKFEVDVTNALKVEVNQAQFDALISLAWNIGINAFKDSYLLQRINEGKKDDREIIEWCFKRYHRAGGKPNILLARRQHEIESYFS